MAGEHLNPLVESGVDRFYELSPDPLFVLDPDGAIAQTNSAFRRLIDGADDYPEERFFDVVHPEDRNVVESCITGLSSGAPVAEMVCRIGCKNNTYQQVSWRLQFDHESGLIHASGRVYPAVSAGDGERQTIQRPAQFFESILYNFGDIVYAWNRQNQFIYGNRRLEEIWGLNPEEFIGKTPADLGYPVDLQELFAQQIKQVFQTRKPVRREIPYTSPHGVFGYYEYMFSPVFDEHGDVEFVGGVSRNTTRRRQVEDALRESEARYRTLFDSIDQGYLLCDVHFDDEGRPVDILYVEANPAAVTMLGQDPVGKCLTEIDPQFEPYWFDIWGRVARTGQPERTERYAGPLDVWFNFFVFKPDSGNPESRRVAVVFQDVTERRRSEAALSESEARQAFLLGLADTLRSLSDPREIMTAAAEALGRQLGVSQVGYCEIEDDQDTAVAGGEFSDGRMPSFVGYRFRLSDYGPGYGPAMRAGEDVYYEDMQDDPRAAPGGSEEMRTMQVRAGAGLPLLKQDRLVAYLYALAPERRAWPEHERLLLREVAERTWAAVERARAEAELRESEARFRESVEIATVGVLFFDLEGRITDANDAFLQMSGYTKEDLEAGLLRWDEMTPLEWMPASWQAVAEMESLGHTTPYEKEYIRKDGSRWWALFAAKSLGRHGNIEYVIDISERKRADEERERLLADAEHERHVAEDAVRARDVFLSIASHELRNPLATIKASSQLLERLFNAGRLDEERGGRLMTTLTTSTGRMAVLLDDLLDVSRLAAGQLRINLDPVNFAELVKDTITEQSATFGSRPLYLDIRDGHVLNLDIDRIRQVLVNILDNAVKYSPPDSELRVTLTYDDESALLKVQDRGIGVPAESRESIFEPFGRASNAEASNIPGMGLGLYICRRIAEAHSGRLWGESGPDDTGTIMCLWLPIGDRGDRD